MGKNLLNTYYDACSIEFFLLKCCNCNETIAALTLVCSGALVVRVLILHSDNRSSNPGEVYSFCVCVSFCLKIMKIATTDRPGLLKI